MTNGLIYINNEIKAMLAELDSLQGATDKEAITRMRMLRIQICDKLIEFCR